MLSFSRTAALILLLADAASVVSFTPLVIQRKQIVLSHVQQLHSTTPPLPGNGEDPSDGIIEAEVVEEQKEIVGNLVADDEWAGVTMELSELVQRAVVEDLKGKTREFLNGKESYEFGDVSKEIDARVKKGVADLRGKEDYEVGDLVLSLDKMSKDFTEDLTGKPYEAGDLSVEIDKRVKGAVAQYVGKDTYEAGDLTKAVSEKVKVRVEDLTKNYKFGDISAEIERRRKDWVKDFLGEEAAANYKFGDISRKLANEFTGKEKYEFGDVSKKLAKEITGKDEYEFGDVTKKLLGGLFKKDKK